VRELWIAPILHPAYILRGKWALDPFQPTYLATAKRLAAGEYRPLDINEPPPGADLHPTQDSLLDWRRGIEEIKPFGRACVIDIENAGNHLTVIGCLRLCDSRSVILHFRGMGGALSGPSYSELRFRIRFLYELLADPEITLIFQNGCCHDIPILEGIGFRVEGYCFDTLVGAHAAWPECPKDLQFLAKTYPDEPIPAWKHLIDAEEDGK